MNRLILFDLDGTLMDSAKAVEEAANRVRARKNLGNIAPEAVRQLLSGQMDEKGETALLVDAEADGKERRDALMMFGRYLDVVFTDHARVYPDVVETLERLQTNGFKLGIVSNRITLFLYQWLEYAGLQSYFDPIVGVDLVHAPPPSPEAIQYALRFTDCLPDHTWLVADSHQELWAAQAAGVTPIFAQYGYAAAPPFPSPHQITSFSALASILIDA